MIALNGISSILGALGSLGNTSTDDTSNGSQIGDTRLEKYNTQAEKLLSKYDLNKDKSLNLAEVSLMIRREMTPGTLNAKRLEQVFKALALKGMSQVELSRMLQLADGNGNGNGTLSSAELQAFGKTLTDELAEGISPEKLYAQLSAKALKAGGAQSTGAELETLKSLFQQYNIPKSAYTPDEKTDTTEGGQENPWAKVLEALPGLIGSFQNPGGGGGGGSSPVGSSSVPSLPQVPSLASMTGGLTGMPPFGMPSMETLAGFPFTGLDGKPFNPLFPSQGGASPLNPPLAGRAGLPTAFNPLTTGSAQQPFASPFFAQQNLGLTQGTPSGFIVTSPAATEGTAPAVDPWASPATPPLLTQALPPQALPQVPAPNSGW